ncbi:alpha/beta hydrolase [Azospirillum sp. ST 5-10]|uniref:alpha/beta hydrolase n=1 Tax=unclassified Azospirillum TaxID=2630922 RepID=UPI003F49D4D9
MTAPAYHERYSQAELDAQYTNTGTPQADADLAALRAQSRRNRGALPFAADVPYGAAALETYDVFAPPGAGPAPALLFVHGGQWRFNTTAETSFWADCVTGQGVAFVAVNLPKMPDTRLPAIAAAVTRAFRHLQAHAGRFGVRPERIALAGHSSGAHLAALALATGLAGGPRPPACAYLVSGMYDLEPVARSSRNAALGLSAAEVAAASVTGRLTGVVPPTMVVVGGDESDEFRRQSAEFHARLPASPGNRLQELPGARHFTTVNDLRSAAGAGWDFLHRHLAPDGR